MDSEAERLYKLRHSLAHVLAQAVLEIRPNAKLAFGPPIDTGCYYDFLFDTPVTNQDFEDIEQRMRRIIGERQKFVHSSKSVEDTLAELNQRKEDFKAEYCRELASRGEKEIGFYTNGPFVDMCAGPHLEHTGQIPPDCFALDSVAGAYWRGDETRPQLSRLYVLAFNNKKDLNSYLERRRIAEERDHRRLGKELDLFSINQEMVGGGLILWHPNGAIIRHEVEKHAKERHLHAGYEFVYTPHIGRSVLWETSGHLDFYKSGMFAPIEVEGQAYYAKPMNCPFHCQIYKSQVRSYKDLPKRFAEWGTVYRYEKSGTLHGLTRVRGFTQDDAHLFCREDQMPAEIEGAFNFSLSLIKDFGLRDFQIYLSTRPTERVGGDDKWDAAESALRAVLEKSGMQFSVNEGDGAFYGPKIDICFKDLIDRPWQLSTVQFDFNLPERFDLTYVGADGKEHRPYMVHRALLGSMERFFALLIEHHGGAFPTWLAPVQVCIIPVAEPFVEAARSLEAKLRSKLIRVEVDDSANSFNKKIREAVTRKIPNIAIIGGREAENNSITLRRYCVKEQISLTHDEFIMRLERLRTAHIMDNDPGVSV